jgi:N-acetyl-gamma-glutamyl-phosphate reductase
LAGDGVIIADCASGISGGGREPKQEFHYGDAADTMTAYKVGGHRHTPEIIRNFRQMEGQNSRRDVIFTPHLAPMNRGILATLYIPLKDAPPNDPALPVYPAAAAIEQRCADIRALYTTFYQDEPFVRILPDGLTAATARVRGSNYCDISIHLDRTGSTLIICSAIDNMVKGAAGQAVQNMNIILNYPETSGLTMAPAIF